MKKYYSIVYIMNKFNIHHLVKILIFLFSPLCSADPVLQSHRVVDGPVVDGKATDTVWQDKQALMTVDPIAGIKIEITSVYTNDNVYMLVKFPDATQNKQQKMLHWDETKNRYVTGPEREDTFVFKWNMIPVAMDLSLTSDIPYKADIWYWKSSRTNSTGFADDKIQFYQSNYSKKSARLISKTGEYYYLVRQGDKGKAAYKAKIYLDKNLSVVPKYKFSIPEGSRADIKAKGFWHDGTWTIEFQRALNTGHRDDLQFKTTKNYFFGVSRYEIAGRNVNKNIEEPKFGAGDINELIKLIFLP